MRVTAQCSCILSPCTNTSTAIHHSYHHAKHSQIYANIILHAVLHIQQVTSSEHVQILRLDQKQPKNKQTTIHCTRTSLFLSFFSSLSQSACTPGHFFIYCIWSILATASLAPSLIAPRNFSTDAGIFNSG